MLGFKKKTVFIWDRDIFVLVCMYVCVFVRARARVCVKIPNFI